MPLVINSLEGGHTNTHANTHTYRHLRTEAILRNQGRAWFNNVGQRLKVRHRSIAKYCYSALPYY